MSNVMSWWTEASSIVPQSHQCLFLCSHLIFLSKQDSEKILIRSSFWSFLLCVHFNKWCFYPDFPRTKHIATERKSVMSVVLSATVAKDHGLVSRCGMQESCVCTALWEDCTRFNLVFWSWILPCAAQVGPSCESKGNSPVRHCRIGRISGLRQLVKHPLYTVGFGQVTFTRMVHFQRLLV